MKEIPNEKKYFPFPSGRKGGAFEIILAIDIIDGKCVRLSQGNFAKKKIYNENPLEVAKQFENAGIKRLHLVDLDGTKKGEIVNQNVLETIAAKTKLVIDFGGGIKTTESAQKVFDSGAKMISAGTIAVKNPYLFSEWLRKFGSEKILLGADVKEEKITINGWMETTSISVFDFIKTNIEKGVENIFCTDVSRDGMMQGTSVELYKKIIRQFPEINLIASGGISSMDDIYKLEKIGCSGVIIGKAIYEGKIKLQEVKKKLC